MAIPFSSIRLIARILRDVNVEGNCMTLGVQVLERGTYAAVKKIMVEEKYNYKQLSDDKLFEKQDNQIIHQDRFFKMLGFTNVESLDYLPEDNPTYIINLNEPINAEFHNQYDLVYDGGTLEHCFNPKEVLSNVVKLLKKGGRVIHNVPMTGWLDHGFYQFSPTLFYHFYTANGFINLRTIIQIPGKRSYCIDYDPSLVSAFNLIKKPTLLFFIAEKQAEHPAVIQPVQSCYANPSDSSGEEPRVNAGLSVKDKIKNILQPLVDFKLLSILPGVAQSL